jgi:hypothetical protein
VPCARDEAAGGDQKKVCMYLRMYVRFVCMYACMCAHRLKCCVSLENKVGTRSMAGAEQGDAHALYPSMPCSDSS